jgi:hypothetical protein
MSIVCKVYAVLHLKADRVGLDASDEKGVRFDCGLDARRVDWVEGLGIRAVGVGAHVVEASDE